MGPQTSRQDILKPSLLLWARCALGRDRRLIWRFGGGRPCCRPLGRFSGVRNFLVEVSRRGVVVLVVVRLGGLVPGPGGGLHSSGPNPDFRRNRDHQFVQDLDIVRYSRLWVFL